MKRFMVILTLLFVLTPGAAFAEEEREPHTDGDYTYALLADGTAEIVAYWGNAQTLTVPDTLDGYRVTSIGDEAFSNCDYLTGITLPDSVTDIGSNPFRYCSKLTAIRVSLDHPTLATIDGVLFEKTEKRLVTYPCAFKASSYTIPNGIRLIGDFAFYNCESLNSITIPDSVTDIGNNPFRSCDELTTIRVSPDHPTLATINGVLFEKIEKRLVTYPCAFDAFSYTIPDGIRVIGDYAFSSCDSLMNITIPYSVTDIGNLTFSYCTSLISITIPGSATHIGDRAFFCCFSLTSIIIPDSVTAIGYDVFADCDSLTLTVGRDSYAKTYASENNIPYTYPDANDWLND